MGGKRVGARVVWLKAELMWGRWDSWVGEPGIVQHCTSGVHGTARGCRGEPGDLCRCRGISKSGSHFAVATGTQVEVHATPAVLVRSRTRSVPARDALPHDPREPEAPARSRAGLPRVLLLSSLQFLATWSGRSGRDLSRARCAGHPDAGVVTAGPPLRPPTLPGLPASDRRLLLPESNTKPATGVRLPCHERSVYRLELPPPMSCPTR